MSNISLTNPNEDIDPVSPDIEFIQGDDAVNVGPNPTTHILKLLGNATQGVSTSGNAVTYQEVITVADATTAQKGVMTLATNAETIAGTVTNKAVTPDDLKAKLGVQTSHGIPYGAGTTAAVAWLAEATNGQIPIGSTGNPPVLAALTAGAGIAINNAAGSITVVNTGTGFQWNNVAGVSSAMAVQNGYIANNAGLVTFTLPVTAVLGSTLAIEGLGAGGWTLVENALQTIIFGNQAATITTGSISSTNRYDGCELVCVVADTTWKIKQSIGNLTVV